MEPPSEPLDVADGFRRGGVGRVLPDSIGAMIFYRDETGAPRVRVDPQMDLLAEFFEGDVQDIVEEAHELLKRAREVAAGEAALWEETYDSFTVVVRPDAVALLSPVFEAELVMPTDDFIRAAAGWLDLVRGG